MNFLKNTTSWKHHRCGWEYCILNLINSPLHDENGIVFIGCIEDYLISYKRVIKEPWAGFIHNVPKHAELFLSTYPGTLDLESIFETKLWKLNERSCVGIYCLTNQIKCYIEGKTKKPVNVLKHPTEPSFIKFNWDSFSINSNKKLILVGHWMRKFQDLWDIICPYEKCILKGTNADYSVIDTFLNKNSKQPVHEIERLSSDEYDDLFSKNIIHVPLYDTNANNTIIECIVRNTPVLTTNLPGTKEYLGENYPLFYDTIEEANAKLKDIGLIQRTHEYLKNMDKTDLTIEYFLKSFEDSFIYKNRKMLATRKQKVFL
jgi:hypothetical protein